MADDGQEAVEAPQVRLHVVLVTGDRPMYDGPANRVVAVARYGQIAIGAHHAPMVAALEPGELIIRLGDDDEDKDQYFAIAADFVKYMTTG